MTLRFLRSLIGPSAHNIGRARTEAETKYTSYLMTEIDLILPAMVQRKIKPTCILSFLSTEGGFGIASTGYQMTEIDLIVPAIVQRLSKRTGLLSLGPPEAGFGSGPTRYLMTEIDLIMPAMVKRIIKPTCLLSFGSPEGGFGSGSTGYLMAEIDLIMPALVQRRSLQTPTRGPNPARGGLTTGPGLTVVLPMKPVPWLASSKSAVTGVQSKETAPRANRANHVTTKNKKRLPVVTQVLSPY